MGTPDNAPAPEAAPPAPEAVDPVIEVPPATPEPDPADTPLGPAGERALAAERDARRDAERRAREVETQLEELRRAQLPDHERAIAEAADAARAEVLNQVNSRLFAAELRAATAGRLADPEILSDPEVAVRLLGLQEIPVTDTGDINAEAISAAVASFLEAKPYLSVGATPPGTGTPPALDLGQGARGTPNQKRQLTRTDLASMSPEAIEAARKDGLLADVMAGKG